MKIKTVCILICLTATSALSGNMFAQSKNELSFSVNGGLSTLNSSMTNVFDIGNSHKAGGGFGLGYTYNFSPLLGLKTGVEVSRYKSRFSLATVNGNYMVMVGDDYYLYDYLVTGYRETAQATYLLIPVMLRFNVTAGSSMAWQTAVGTKLGFVADTYYKGTYDVLRTVGIPTDGSAIGDRPAIVDLPDAAFGTWTDGNDSGSIDLRFMCMASVETGMAFRLGEAFSIYAGVYFDYSFNNVRKAKNKIFVLPGGEYPSYAVRINGMMNTTNRRNLENVRFSESAHPLAAGLKLSFSYHF